MTVSDYNNCVDQHSDGLYRFILKHIRDVDAAKDIVQDTFEKMWRKIDEMVRLKVNLICLPPSYHTLIDYTANKKSKVDLMKWMR